MTRFNNTIIKVIILLILVVLVLSPILNTHFFKTFSEKLYELQLTVFSIGLDETIQEQSNSNSSTIIDKSEIGREYYRRIGIDRSSFYDSSIMKEFRNNILMFNIFILLLIILLFIWYNSLKNKRAEKQLAKLNLYLKEINNGNLALDIRDNQEGNLSLLKNNIYKITQKMKNSNNLLLKQKIELSSAISNISHQIKTPLTSMQLMTDLLSREDLEVDKRDEFLNNMQSQLNRLRWLVTSLLKLAKFDANTVDFTLEKVIVKDVFDKVRDYFTIPLELKEIDFIIKKNNKVSFKGDLNWTIEAFNNIISNCIEHSRKKGIIEIDFDDNSLYTLITIKDNGEGIRKQDIPHIFTRFYKGSNARSDSVGIGLALAKSIIEKQDGDIKVISKENEGTKFIIKFYKNII